LDYKSGGNYFAFSNQTIFENNIQILSFETTCDGIYNINVSVNVDINNPVEISYNNYSGSSLNSCIATYGNDCSINEQFGVGGKVVVVFRKEYAGIPAQENTVKGTIVYQD